MSEFKFACPVCGQHMMCDTSQGGSVMDCPTCFQKVTAPQAPAPDAKFVLTGTKVVEKTLFPRGLEPATGPVAAKGKIPAAIVIGALAVGLAVGATVFFLRGKIFPPAAPPVKTAATNAARPPKSAPVLVAPPASDTNWVLTLAEAVIPEAPVAGRIHGEDFLMERATFQVQNGLLTLRRGTRGTIESGVQIHFSGMLPESLAGKTLNILSNASVAARVTLWWKAEGGAANKAGYDSGYALRLEFGDLAKNRLPGKIYLCTPDVEKSYLMGTFNANVIRPKPKTPAPAAAPQ